MFASYSTSGVCADPSVSVSDPTLLSVFLWFALSGHLVFSWQTFRLSSRLLPLFCGVKRASSHFVMLVFRVSEVCSGTWKVQVLINPSLALRLAWPLTLIFSLRYESSHCEKMHHLSARDFCSFRSPVLNWQGLAFFVFGSTTLGFKPKLSSSHFGE